MDNLEFTYIPVKPITELLPELMMLLYGCIKHGAVEIDKTNHTITIQNFAYDLDKISRYLTQIQQERESYYQQITTMPGATSPNPNDTTYINDIENILIELKQWLQ
jgi:hypothetical protein